MNRGYSWLNVRSVDEEKRIIEGIATTPTVARDGDILETSGIQFKLPLPFLWRHKEPFGNVMSAEVGADGIKVRIQVGAAGISQAIDEQWRMVKAGLVRGLSIGWRTLEESFMKEIGGFRIIKSEWLELSAVPVPADANATMTSVRSVDEVDLAALGNRGSRPERTPRSTPGASGSQKRNGGKMAKSFEERERELEARRKPIQERMTTVMELVETEAREMTEAEASPYDADAEELAKIDTDLKRLRAHQQAVKGARPVQREAGEGVEDRSRDRRPAVEVTEQMPKGTRMARMVIALVRAQGNKMHAADLAREYYRDTPEVAMVLRAAVAAGDTTTSGWASQLIPAATQMQSEFLDLLRPSTLLGRIPGLRQVPFNVKVPMQTGGGTYHWVGEGKSKPVTKGTFDSATLRWAKTAGIIVITDELARFSSPAAEGLIRNELVQGTARFLDSQFVDSSVAEVANVSPGSITNGVNAKTPQGSGAAAFRFDLNVLLKQFITDSQNPTSAVLLMSATTAVGLSMLMNALGQAEFPGITMAGGTINGLPVVVSESVGDRVILLNASDILFADDGGVNIDMSREASIEMDTAPTGDDSPPGTPVMTSLWQQNMVGLRVERYITWKRARASAVAWLDNVTYGPVDPGSPA